MERPSRERDSREHAIGGAWLASCEAANRYTDVGERMLELLRRPSSRTPSLRGITSFRLDDAGFESAIGVPRIAAAVVACQNGVEAVDEIAFRKMAGLRQVMKQLVALRVDVGAGDVRDLPG